MAEVNGFTPMEWEMGYKGWTEEKEEIRQFALARNKYEENAVILDAETLRLITWLENEAAMRRRLKMCEAKCARIDALYLTRG